MSSEHDAFEIRRGEKRGETRLRWLYARHSFSFGRYYDEKNLGFRALRVINEDVIEPSSGFGEHGHENMEILTWVLEGKLHHRDSTGGEGTLVPGELQAMTAGRGIRHSEVNDSAERVHLLQIWIEPAALNLPPSYGQKRFLPEGRNGRWQLLASPEGKDGSMQIHQDAVLSVAELGDGRQLPVTLEVGRYGYLHVSRGAVQIEGAPLGAGDAITFRGPREMVISARDESQLLLFDLA